MSAFVMPNAKNVILTEAQPNTLYTCVTQVAEAQAETLQPLYRDEYEKSILPSTL